MGLLKIKDRDNLCDSSHRRVEQAIASKNWCQENKWTESIAVGSKGFVEATKEKLGIKAKGRTIHGKNATYELREPSAPYNTDSALKNTVLRLKNSYFWEDNL